MRSCVMPQLLRSEPSVWLRQQPQLRVMPQPTFLLNPILTRCLLHHLCPLQLRDAAAAEKRAKRLAEAAAAAEELKARRRALGNIQYIGQLYRFGMLTENIMHR
jgi:hypothetical protein